MPSYRHGAHTVFEIHLHVVWTTEYRKPVMVGEVSLRVRELIRQVCEREEFGARRGTCRRTTCICSYRSRRRVTISRLVQRLKGRSSHTLMMEFAHLRKAFWGRHFSRLEPGTSAGFSRNRDFQSQTEATGFGGASTNAAFPLVHFGVVSEGSRTR